MDTITTKVDLSKPTQAESTLRDSEEMLRLAVQAGRMFAYSWDAATDVVERSGEAAEILGIEPGTAATGAEISAMVHPSDRERLHSAMARLTVESPRLKITYRVVRPDGGVIWLDRNSRAYFDEDGKMKRLVGMVADVTDRKVGEEARSRHSAIVASSEDAIISKDLNGVIESWNAGAERMFGYSAAEAIGQPITILFPPELREEEETILETVRTGKRIEQYETVRVTKTGNKLNVSLSISPVKDSSGRVVGIAKIARNITERKRTEKALRASEEHFRTLAEAIPQLCWMAHPDGQVFWYNQRWYAYTGSTPEQMEGSGWQSVHDPRVLPEVIKRWEASISTGEPFDMVFPLRAADGVFRPFLTRVMPIKDADGQVVRWFGTDTDITELRDAQERLRISEERLRMGQWAAHIGTFDLDIKTGVNFWTPETEALFGLPPGGFGRSVSAFEELIHPDDRGRVIELNREALRTGRPIESEWRVIWPDGSLHWIAGRGQVLMDESGKPSRMLGVNIDITKSKQVEEELSGMTRKLVEAQEQERARIGRELHDDINQRLALLTIELSQIRNQSDLSSEVRERLQELQETTSDISTSVYDLSHELHFSTLDYLGLVKGMQSWCEEYGRRHELEIDFKNDEVPALPREASLCLFRVLQEALHNAAKHSGVKRIEVQLTEAAGEIHLVVRDSGKGFDLEGAKRGLGLTSMQERVRLVGGTILIESRPLAGTNIQVRVPFRGERRAQWAAG